MNNAAYSVIYIVQTVCHHILLQSLCRASIVRLSALHQYVSSFAEAILVVQSMPGCNWCLLACRMLHRSPGTCLLWLVPSNGAAPSLLG